jgi:hypothetical protein
MTATGPVHVALKAHGSITARSYRSHTYVCFHLDLRYRHKPFHSYIVVTLQMRHQVVFLCPDGKLEPWSLIEDNAALLFHS